MKVVINDKHGGFGISAPALVKYAERKGLKFYFYLHDYKNNIHRRVGANEARKDGNFTIFTKDLGKEVADVFLWSEAKDDAYFSIHDIERHDPDLVAVVEELGNKANDGHSKLKVVEIPDDVEYIIQEHAGIEWIAEKHRTWS